MTLDKHVLLARFRLNPEMLANHKIAVLDFPYAKALSVFQNSICRIRSVDKLDWEEQPPYRQLNDVLVASSPLLIHAFEKKTRFSSDRSMMAFAEMNGQPIWRPGIEQIKSVTRVWARLWAEQTFPNEVNGTGRQAFDCLLESITMSPETSWQEYNALDLWKDPDGHDHLGWDAIPNLLAAMLVSTQQENVLVDAKGIRRSFKWMLSQDGDKRLAIVSPLLESENEGRYAYVGSFSVQTQAGSTDNRWIYLKIGVRRYMDRPVTKVKKVSNDVSIMVQVKSPRIKDWEVSSTFVSLSASGTPQAVRWSNDVPALLAALNLRPLAEVKDIYKSPDKFLGNAEGSDTYHIVFSEGMRPRHRIKAGIGLKERSEIVSSILSHMGGVLEADVPQPIDECSVLSVRDFRNKRDETKQLQLLAMFTQDDLDDIRVARGASDTEDIFAKQKLTVEALQRATQGQQLRILILHRTTDSGVALEKYVKKTLFIGDTPPSGLDIVCVPIHGEIGTAPVISDKVPWNPSAKSEWKKQKDQREKDARAAYDAKVSKWKSFLSTTMSPHGYTLALIEMDGSMEDITLADEFHKSALRRACVSLGINSQMIFTVTEKALDTKAREGREQVSRIKRATNDLLLRWPHVMYGPPSQIYHFAGLPDEIAEQLVVVGLYRHRTFARPNVDLPVAVFLMPDGAVKVSLPTEDGIPMSPVSYLEAGPRLGTLFAKYRTWQDRNIISLVRDTQTGQKNYVHFARFVYETITTSYLGSSPVLILLEASGWRTQVIPSLTDPVLTNGLLDLSKLVPAYGRYEPRDLPNIRVIRIRDAGNLGETPQYVATTGHHWESVDDADDEQYMFGINDTSVSGNVPHYYSIGRRPKSVKEPGNEAYLFGEGGEIAHKHQQAIEFVPFFLQEQDDPSAWCRVAHFLRSSPAWNGGNIVLPYPLHLAKTLMDDEMDVFRPPV